MTVFVVVALEVVEVDERYAQALARAFGAGELALQPLLPRAPVCKRGELIRQGKALEFSA